MPEHDDTRDAEGGGPELDGLAHLAPDTEDDGPDLAGLDHLTPDVDVTAAAGSFRRERVRRAQRRRVLQGSAAAGLLVVVAVVGVIVVGQRDGGGGKDRVVAVGDPDPSASTTVTKDGLEITLTAPIGGNVGTRVPFTVTLRNVSGGRLLLGEAGECHDQVGAALAPAAETASDPQVVPGSMTGYGTAIGPQGVPGWMDEDPAVAWWDGDRATLATFLQAAPPVLVIPAQAAGAENVRAVVCRQDLRPPARFEAGEELTKNLSVDLRWGPSELPDHFALTAAAGITTRDMLAGEMTRIEVSAPFTIHDDARRLPSLEQALGATGLPAALTFQDWLDQSLTSLPANLRPQQTWTPALSWWRGAWELWVEPKFMDGKVTGPIRIRWDADAAAVVDVRTVQAGNAGADDEPGGPPDGAPDKIRYHRD